MREVQNRRRSCVWCIVAGMDETKPVPEKRPKQERVPEKKGEAYVTRDIDGTEFYIWPDDWANAIEMRKKGRSEPTIAAGMNVHVGILNDFLKKILDIWNDPKIAADYPEWMWLAARNWFLAHEEAIGFLEDVAYDRAAEGSLGHWREVMNKHGRLKPDPGSYDPYRDMPKKEDDATIIDASLDEEVDAMMRKKELTAEEPEG